MKKIFFFLLALISLSILGGFLYAKMPKTSNLICKDFNGFRKLDNGNTVNWHIDTIRITLINDTFGFNRYGKNMLAYLVDSAKSASIFKNELGQDATLNDNQVLQIFVPTPQTNVGMLSLKIDMVAGDANLSTWEYAGGPGNGILKGKCDLGIKQ
jgi:hypothetical protein